MLSTGPGISTAYQHVIHSLSTSYSQAAGYPQLIHRISTGLSTILSYPQVIHRLSTTFHYVGSTYPQLCVLVENVVQPYCNIVVLHVPYDHVSGQVNKDSCSGAVHPLLFEQVYYNTVLTICQHWERVQVRSRVIKIVLDKLVKVRYNYSLHTLESTHYANKLPRLR